MSRTVMPAAYRPSTRSGSPFQARLARLDQLGLEGPLAGARHLQGHRAVLGVHRLWRRAVARIPRVVVAQIVAVVAEMFGQLGVQRPLDHALGQLRQQPTVAKHLLLVIPVLLDQLVD
jgi:hypothetical protein